VIDDALRKASLERGVRVRMLASLWNHTRHDMIYFLHSLSDVSSAMNADIQVVSDLSSSAEMIKYFRLLLLLLLLLILPANFFSDLFWVWSGL